MAASSDNNRWYRDGLHFECTLCGKCCTGEEGYVWVTIEEVAQLAELLGLELDEFGTRYLRRVGRRYSLIEDTASGRCTFLVDDRCSVHEHRPTQCRRFPFWPEHLENAASWAACSRECEGINPDAPLVDARTIERLRRS